ncbi:hypothetical protein FHS20_005129 [Phyllobacterium endophyticum]|nr:hypothetical protein [Phyllobacterium endophyticum]
MPSRCCTKATKLPRLLQYLYHSLIQVTGFLIKTCLEMTELERQNLGESAITAVLRAKG